MAENRYEKRHRKRMTIKFGIEAPCRTAFTEDISLQGIFIKTGFICPPGSRLKIDLTLPDGTEVRLTGVVKWAKKVPPNMIRLVRKCGMGVRITGLVTGAEEYRRMCEELQGRVASPLSDAHVPA